MFSNTFNSLWPFWSSGQTIHKLAIAAVIKNEGPYLLEWIAFHRVVGVEKFFIADNVSTDGTSELLMALAAIGWVERLHFPTRSGRPLQMSAYRALMRRCLCQAEWIAIIDADEFIVPTDEMSSIKPLLRFMDRCPEVGAIALNWAMYGSSYHEEPTNNPVIERFSMRADVNHLLNHHYKSIVRAESLLKVGYNPHHFPLRRDYRYAQTNGAVVRQHEKGLGLSVEVVWDRARVNHYFGKSKAEFKLLKASRVRPDTGEPRRDKSFIDSDRNDVVDPMRDDLIKATRSEMENLRKTLLESGCDERIARLDQRLIELIRHAQRAKS